MKTTHSIEVEPFPEVLKYKLGVVEKLLHMADIDRAIKEKSSNLEELADWLCINQPNFLKSKVEGRNLKTKESSKEPVDWFNSEQYILWLHNWLHAAIVVAEYVDLAPRGSFNAYDLAFLPSNEIILQCLRSMPPLSDSNPLAERKIPQQFVALGCLRIANGLSIFGTDLDDISTLVESLDSLQRELHRVLCFQTSHDKVTARAYIWHDLTERNLRTEALIALQKGRLLRFLGQYNESNAEIEKAIYFYQIFLWRYSTADGREFVKGEKLLAHESHRYEKWGILRIGLCQMQLALGAYRRGDPKAALKAAFRATSRLAQCRASVKKQQVEMVRSMVLLDLTKPDDAQQLIVLEKNFTDIYCGFERNPRLALLAASQLAVVKIYQSVSDLSAKQQAGQIIDYMIDYAENGESNLPLPQQLSELLSQDNKPLEWFRISALNLKTLLALFELRERKRQNVGLSAITKAAMHNASLAIQSSRWKTDYRVLYYQALVNRIEICLELEYLHKAAHDLITLKNNLPPTSFELFEGLYELLSAKLAMKENDIARARTHLGNWDKQFKDSIATAWCCELYNQLQKQVEESPEIFFISYNDLESKGYGGIINELKDWMYQAVKDKNQNITVSRLVEKAQISRGLAHEIIKKRNQLNRTSVALKKAETASTKSPKTVIAKAAGR